MKNLKFISIDPELQLLKVLKSIEIEENSYDFTIARMLRYQFELLKNVLKTGRWGLQNDVCHAFVAISKKAGMLN
jgi:hypothetical protein